MNCPFKPNLSTPFWSKLKSLFASKNADDKYLEVILDTTVDAIITINENKQIQAFNKAAEHIFGFTKEEVMDKNINIIMPEPFHSKHDEYVDHYLKTGEKKIIGIGREVIAKKKDGSTFPIDLSVSEVIVNNKRFFTGIIRDITVKKEAEALKLKTVFMQAEADARNKFVAILSHELRSPVTSIYAALSLLLEEKDLSENIKELLMISYRNAERLRNLITDALYLGKLQAGKLKIDSKPIHLVLPIKEAIITSRLIANPKGIEIVDKVPSSDLLVFADYDRLIQVCLNLLSNAINFSPPGEKIIISMKIQQDKVCICIEDHGTGIPKAFQPQIFTPFFQVNSQGVKQQGAGLGLHICKGIIDEFGGTIGFDSKESVGSTFYFELPILKASSEIS